MNDLAVDDGIVLCLSGGIDSVTAAAMLSHRGSKVLPLFVDYGQRCAVQEHAAALEATWRLSLAPLRVFDATVLSELRATEPSDLWRRRFLPHRNLLLLSIAAMYGASIGVEAVSFGIVRDDNDPIPDTTQAFRSAAERALATTAPGIVVFAPLAGMSKAEVVRWAVHHDVDLSTTVSCLDYGPEPCGSCNGCREREAVLGCEQAVS